MKIESEIEISRKKERKAELGHRYNSTRGGEGAGWIPLPGVLFS